MSSKNTLFTGIPESRRIYCFVQKFTRKMITRSKNNLDESALGFPIGLKTGFELFILESISYKLFDY